MAQSPAIGAKSGDYGLNLVNTARSADEAWTGLLSLSQQKPVLDYSKVNPRPAPPEVLSPAERLVQASQAAGAYAKRFTSDQHAREAGKLEAMLALQAVQAGATEFKGAARTVAMAYRAEKSNSAADRFDVAFAMDGMALAETLKGKRFLDDGEKYEALADALRTELGDTDEVLGLYVTIIRTTDVATSTRVAKKLIDGATTPEWVRTQAQVSLDRSKLIGKPLGLKLKMLGGSELDLSLPQKQPTVIYFWHAMNGPADLEIAEKFKAASGTAARWIFVGLGGTAPVVSGDPMTGSPFADSHCYEAAQQGRPSITYLKVPTAPYAFVLDAAGAVVGYGFPENIAALLKAAQR